MQIWKKKKIKVTKSFRTRFNENYVATIIPADNKRGYKVEYVYYAPWYIWKISEEIFQKQKRILLGMEIGSLILFLAIVLLRISLNSNKIVYGITALNLCVQILEIAALIDFMIARRKTTKIQYENINRGLIAFTTIRSVLSSFAALICILLIANKNMLSVKSMGMVLGLLICSYLAWEIKRTYQQIPFITEENDTLKKIYGAESKSSKVQ